MSTLTIKIDGKVIVEREISSGLAAIVVRLIKELVGVEEAPPFSEAAWRRAWGEEGCGITQ